MVARSEGLSVALTVTTPRLGIRGDTEGMEGAKSGGSGIFKPECRDATGSMEFVQEGTVSSEGEKVFKIPIS